METQEKILAKLENLEKSFADLNSKTAEDRTDIQAIKTQVKSLSSKRSPQVDYRRVTDAVTSLLYREAWNVVISESEIKVNQL